MTDGALQASQVGFLVRLVRGHHLERCLVSQVTIKRIERNKRKHVTAIHGLEAFGTSCPTVRPSHPRFMRLRADVDLKKAAKFFAQKFATGASVTKNPQGLGEIVVQGDVSGDIVEMIEDGVGLLKNVPKDNIVEVEEKVKKG